VALLKDTASSLEETGNELCVCRKVNTVCSEQIQNPYTKSLGKIKRQLVQKQTLRIEKF